VLYDCGTLMPVINTSFARSCSRAILTFVGIAMLASSAHVAAAQTGTATAFYMTYRTAFDKAQKIEELLPYLAAKNRQEVEKTPADERVKFFMMMKMFGAMKDVKVLKTTKTGNGETLAVEGMVDGKKQTCAVQILNESGAWKVGEEKCSGSF